MCARAPLCGSGLAILAEKAIVRGIDEATIDCTGSAFFGQVSSMVDFFQEITIQWKNTGGGTTTLPYHR